MNKVRELLIYKINIRLVTLVAFLLLITLGIPLGSYVQTKVQCRVPISQYEKAIKVVAELDSKARSEWDSFPLYENWFGGDARDPNGGGGRIYSDFEQYFGEKYGYESDSELRISQLLVIQNPKCFSPREVAEAQDYLDKVK